MTNMDEVEAFAGQVVADVAATLSGVMTNLGHRLGIYRAMAGAGQLTSGQIAKATGLHERYVREWLGNQVAGGYIIWHREDLNYSLPDAHVPVLADPESPVFLVPALEVAASLWFDEDKLADAFQSGEGIAWSDHHHRLFCGSEALFRPGYKANLVGDWIGAVPGIQSKLKSGAKIADVGCGHGASAILLANAYPGSFVHGYDYHKKSVQTAMLRAREAGCGDNLSFQVARASDYEEGEFDLICFMDCLHDMGDPVGAARHARKALKSDGRVLLVEPAAQDELADNINPVSRLYYAASTAVCTPSSLSQEVGAALGAQAGEKRLSEVMMEAGFTSVNRVAETPFNIVLECVP